MNIGVFDIFKIGIGPSSSHTVGPMRAAKRFVECLAEGTDISRTAGVRVELFGRLGHTGHGHGSDLAVTLGLEGESPENTRFRFQSEKTSCSTGAKSSRYFRTVCASRRSTSPARPFSSACMTRSVAVSSSTKTANPICSRRREPAADVPVSHRFDSGADLLRLCAERGLSIATLMLENERAAWPETQLRARLLEIAYAMESCVERGCRREGILPGGLETARGGLAVNIIGC